MLENRQNKKQVGETLFLPRRGPFCPWSANRESKLLNKWSFPGGSSLRRADVSSSLITTEGRFTRRKRSLSGDERGETSAVRRPGGGGRGDILYNGLYGEASAPPERGTFIRLQVYERVEILLVEVFKRGGKSVILVSERAQKDLRMNFLAL